VEDGKKSSAVLCVSSVFSVVKKPEIGGPKPARRLERSFYSSEKTDKMFKKGGSTPWKNASKPLERWVKLLVELTKCIGRTAQTLGRTGSKLWKNGSTLWKNWLKVLEERGEFQEKTTHFPCLKGSRV
jgi:hypothetical protein